MFWLGKINECESTDACIGLTILPESEPIDGTPYERRSKHDEVNQRRPRVARAARLIEREDLRQDVVAAEVEQHSSLHAYDRIGEMQTVLCL